MSSVLSSTLGRQFAVTVVTRIDRAKAVIDEGVSDFWVVDADSEYDRLGQWRTFVDEPAFTNGVPVILMATDENRQEIQETAGGNVYECIRKPPAMPELKAHLRKAFDTQALRAELESARRHLQLQRATGLDQIIGSSIAMQGVYDLIRRVARLEASVLVTGESGTGKELVARAIHNLGQRANRPFVAISCGAIPETLIEAELFGHERGAFTGSVNAREGYLEKAGDGTLFFDEIGELSLSTQVKLLRVLQQREFCRLGSSRPIPLRARIVFATHRDLAAMVAERKFRQDLFYRINVIGIQVPSLAERAEDIRGLADHFLRKYCDQYRKQMAGIEAGALARLCDYDWPGNVRELENVIQHAIVMAEEERVRTCDLPTAIQELEVGDAADHLPEGSFERILRDYKVKVVKEAIRKCNGNKTLAAQSLCISRAYLHRLIRTTSDVVVEEAEVLAIEPDYQFAPVVLAH